MTFPSKRRGAAAGGRGVTPADYSPCPGSGQTFSRDLLDAREAIMRLMTCPACRRRVGFSKNGIIARHADIEWWRQPK